MGAAGGQVGGDVSVTAAMGKGGRMSEVEVLGVVARVEVAGAGMEVVGDGGVEVGVEVEVKKRFGVVMVVM